MKILTQKMLGAQGLAAVCQDCVIQRFVPLPQFLVIPSDSLVIPNKGRYVVRLVIPRKARNLGFC